MSQKTPDRKKAATALAPQQISEEVLIEKYSKNGEKTILDVNKRVARALAEVEAANADRIDA